MIDALALAELSAAAYTDAPTWQRGDVCAIRRDLDDRTTVVAFRGTVNVQDALRDARAWPSYDPHLGWCHSGFLSGARSVAMADLAGRRVIFTGHSLGGDLAILTAAMFVVAGHLPRAIVTFNAERLAQGKEPSSFICYRGHSFVRDGQIQFLGDCTRWRGRRCRCRNCRKGSPTNRSPLCARRPPCYKPPHGAARFRTRHLPHRQHLDWSARRQRRGKGPRDGRSVPGEGQPLVAHPIGSASDKFTVAAAFPHTDLKNAGQTST